MVPTLILTVVVPSSSLTVVSALIPSGSTISPATVNSFDTTSVKYALVAACFTSAAILSNIA